MYYHLIFHFIQFTLMLVYIFLIQHLSNFHVSFVYVDMCMESQARSVTDEIVVCSSTKDCRDKNYPCPSPLVLDCVANVCTCIHLQPTSTNEIHAPKPSVTN